MKLLTFVYKNFIWPGFRVILPLDSRCKYYPTCSEYASLATKKYGLFKGSFLSIIRILSCNPFAKGGVDYP